MGKVIQTEVFLSVYRAANYRNIREGRGVECFTEASGIYIINKDKSSIGGLKSWLRK